MCGIIRYPVTSSGKSFIGFLRHWSSENFLEFKPVTKDQTFTGFMKSYSSSTSTLKFIVLLLILFHIQSATALKIKRMNVPRCIENGTVDSVILDCEYSYTERDTLLVVKWYLDSDPEPIYQWITEFDTRHASARYQGHINLNFMATPSNKMTRFRALNIIKPTTMFNGKYTCHVVSLTSQDTSEKTMIVYVPPKKFDFNYTKTTNTGANISCEASDVFPIPHLMLYRSTIYDKEPLMLFDVHSQYENTANGAFDLRVSHEIIDKALPSGQPAKYECVISIPGTTFEMQKKIIYYPGLAIDSASIQENLRILWITIVAFGVCFS